LNPIERIAVDALCAHGESFHRATRAGGWTNQVWIAGDIVVRVSPSAGTDRIRREAALAAHLPDEIGYPKMIETGVTDGHEWSVSKRIAGTNLSDAWANLDWDARTRAARRIWSMIRAMRSLDPARIPVPLPRHPWYSSFDPAQSRADAQSLLERGVLAQSQAAALDALLARFYDALSRAPLRFVHGDITFDNIMYAGGALSLLDFEHAALAPGQVDISNFLRLALGPESAQDEPPSPGRDRFIEGVLALARPAIACADAAHLLLGCAALISLRRVHIWLGGNQAGEPWDAWEPHRALVSLLDGRGGYLAPLVRAYL
jgi:aminoglycoside phosphotransferase (APT) family kinase protein